MGSEYHTHRVLKESLVEQSKNVALLVYKLWSYFDCIMVTWEKIPGSPYVYIFACRGSLGTRIFTECCLFLTYRWSEALSCLWSVKNNFLWWHSSSLCYFGLFPILRSEHTRAAMSVLKEEKSLKTKIHSSSWIWAQKPTTRDWE